MAKLSRISPELPVLDRGESIKYYEPKPGFQVATELPGREYAILERDDIAIHLFRDDAGSHSPVGIHIFTHDLDELHDELQRRGARVTEGITRKPWGNRDFRVNDYSGNSDHVYGAAIGAGMKVAC